ncbi:RNA-binding transcriptional accessory protein [Lampropedia puyangensis]|uniref:RNA-binding transcriptional accessory protein n=1 Tax=Lampropedia puyangensis TaxID=1330072 RepID=A0A4V4GQM7_9BURK|nr:Tex family protein [Lampropedia puyangensis]THT97945.1 RNA-binding transcriptional accessory protein [Lampropedia puyangensis]
MATIDLATQQRITQLIAQELSASARQVESAIALLDEGATVPFIARYRKEATGGLDDVQLRALDERLGYLRELEQRRQAIVKSIEEQGKLTPILATHLAQVMTKQELEDIYLPYKPKRRTKGQIAKEAGLEPLALSLFADPNLVPIEAAQAFVKAEKSEDGADFTTVNAVLDGARDILVEAWAEDAALVQHMRQWLWDTGVLVSQLIDGKNPDESETAKFKDYFAYDEPIARIPSHRALAVFRGRSLDILHVRLTQEIEPEPGKPSLAEGRLALQLKWSHQQRAADDWLRKAVAWLWRVKLSLSLERDLFAKLREAAEGVAIKVFGDNLRDLLLAAPAGSHTVMGLDPGIRTGVKVAVVDATGKLLDTATVFPHEPRRDWQGALHTLAALCAKHRVVLIAIGNGTASRETDKLAAELVKMLADKTGHHMQKVVVSEAGASVYSASAFASEEMPDVDVSLRGAASIARRLQDPLAELVKIDPKSIGVGQYQHDVNQTELARALDAVVEDCVNGVGVDLNTASAPLLARVSGLSNTVARAVVRWREANGAFKNRQQLLKVSGLGPKAFEQSAGFLRIRDGDNPLDTTGVHPETYPIVEAILQTTGKPVDQLMGNTQFLKTLKPEQFARDGVGSITVKDILSELEKPGRDPRPDFVVARFNDGVEDIADLRPDMVLEGTVSNVAQFGAFVDLGVHQDGLIHVSQLANRFVEDAREVVKTGQVVKVKVLEVDVPRKRISLTMRLDAVVTRAGDRSTTSDPKSNMSAGRDAKVKASSRGSQQAPQSAMQSAFAKLKGLK